MNTRDTIIAPATPPGSGGIAIVRISGAESLSLLNRFFNPSSGHEQLLPNRLYHGVLLDGFGDPLDEVMAVYMKSPHSYTCEDVVEIHCHGSSQVVKSVLSLYQSVGIRLAEPGEFTYRAFMNGRLDLSQAEAVSRLIHSRTDSARRLALSQVDGGLSREIYSFSKTIKNNLVLLEAWIDFPEEDLPEEDILSISVSIDDIISKIDIISGTYNVGRVLSEGASIVLVGQPNVGKSSLLNALLLEERAIVTDIPGTTRDLLEEGLTINDVPLRLIDTAGLRQSSDVIELEGIKRAEAKLILADLVLLLVDGSKELDENDLYVLDRCKGLPVFIVSTKSDLGVGLSGLDGFGFPIYKISAKTGQGLDRLRKGIAGFLIGSYSSSSDTILLSERRHYESLLLCKENLTNFNVLKCSNDPLELMAFELREALYCLGKITGETTTESLLDDIFSGFCIGK